MQRKAVPKFGDRSKGGCSKSFGAPHDLYRNFASGAPTQNHVGQVNRDTGISEPWQHVSRPMGNARSLTADLLFFFHHNTLRTKVRALPPNPLLANIRTPTPFTSCSNLALNLFSQPPPPPTVCPPSPSLTRSFLSLIPERLRIGRQEAVSPEAPGGPVQPLLPGRHRVLRDAARTSGLRVPRAVGRRPLCVSSTRGQHTLQALVTWATRGRVFDVGVNIWQWPCSIYACGSPCESKWLPSPNLQPRG